MNVATLDSLVSDARDAGESFHEFLRRDALSAGMYLLPAGGVDDQAPHREDEIYVIHKGSGKIRIADETIDISPGSVIFVAANVEHRFFDFAEELEILVIFAPAYTGRG